ncbi:MAG: hypothetical protein ABI556_14935 [Gemmatimonadales bacterium]
MRRVFLSILVLAVAACTDGTTTVEPMNHDDNAIAALRNVSGTYTAEVNAGLAQIRQVTAGFHDFEKAQEAGYTTWSPNPFAPGATCPSNSEGNMGYHLVNVPLRGGAGNPAAGDATIDLLQPEMLLYEKKPNGTMRLVGVEYIVFKAAWEAANGIGAPPPEILGQPLLEGSHTFPGGTGSIPHYELHVWVWSRNSLGMFYPWNPDVSC